MPTVCPRSGTSSPGALSHYHRDPFPHTGMSLQSANYCRTSGALDTAVMLLCEVALGDMYELTRAEYMEKPPKHYHSTKGVLFTLFCTRPLLPTWLSSRSFSCKLLLTFSFSLSLISAPLSVSLSWARNFGSTGCGRVAPREDQSVVLENGCIVPLGKSNENAVRNSSLIYNEFIV